MPKYTKEELYSAVKNAHNISETLRNLQMCTTGNSRKILNKYITLWNIDTSHFSISEDTKRKLVDNLKNHTHLNDILIENSNYSRTHLKKRLYKEGLKTPICELCGQDENWNGKRMSLILDHINGVNNDNRLENLRIVCPNCNSTLDTHCGKNNLKQKPVKSKSSKSSAFLNTCFCGNPTKNKKYCSRKCYYRSIKNRPKPQIRKVERPDINFLLKEIETTSFTALGRKYGVSDNAIRKWIKHSQNRI